LFLICHFYDLINYSLLINSLQFPHKPPGLRSPELVQDTIMYNTKTLMTFTFMHLSDTFNQIELHCI